MACLTQVPVPKPGTGGCPCPTAPDPCGTGRCVHWSDPITCGPPVVDCLGCPNCTWIKLASAPQCGGSAAGVVLPILGLLTVGGVIFVVARHAHHRDEYHGAAPIAHGVPGHAHAGGFAA